jgi:Tfp pilus assembly protein PilZ
MSDFKERRYSQRHQFPDSNVLCRENIAMGIIKQYSEPFPLNDLNKSGLGFQTEKEFSYGDKVHLKIEIPGHQKIQLIGEVRWVSEDYQNPHKNVGVQFLPFGTMRGYNSFSSREKLERLISPLEHRTSLKKDLLH